MISRWAKVAAGISLGAVILTAVLGGAALWRLSKGPVGVDFLTPLVETAFADLIPDHSLDIGHTVLAWERGRGTFDLRLLGASIQGREGADIVTLPMFKVGLDLETLVRGKVRPSTIEIDKARIHLIRDAGGIIGFSDGETPTSGRGGDDEQPGKQSKVILAVLKNLIDPSGPASALSRLETVRLVNGGISLDDRMTGNIWNAPLVNIELRRNAAGLVGEIQVNFAAPNDVGEFQATFTYDPRAELLQLTGQISNLGTPALSLLAPSLGSLAQSDLTFSGSFNLSFAHLGRFQRARFDVSSGPGKISLPGLLAKPIKVSEAKARGRYDGANRGFELDLASVSFRTTAGSISTLNLTGSARDLGGNVLLEAEARLDTLPIDDLKSYWPQGLGERTRDWIGKNILAGTLDEASVAFAASLPDGDFGRAVIKSLNGTFGYRGVEAHYLRPLAPATDVLGQAEFDRKAMRLKIERANVSDLKVTGAEIDFIGPGGGRKLVVKRVQAEGPLRAMLGLLDQPRFKLLSGLGAVPEVIGGRVSLAAGFAIPLRANPTSEDIEFQVQGSIKQASFKNILMGRNAARADLAFSLDRDGMTLNGPVEFAGIPVTLAWKEAFAETAPLRREIRADFHGLGEAERARLGLATEHFVGGPVSGSLLAEIGRHGKGTLTTRLNLEDAELALPFADWSKAAGEPATASFTFEIANGRIVALHNVEIEAGTLKAKGTGSLGDSGWAGARLDLVRLIIGKSDLRDVSILRRGASTEITIGDGVLDAHPFLTPTVNVTKVPADPSARGIASGGERRENAMVPGLAFALTAPALRRVYLARDRYLDNVAVRLNRTARGWDLIQLRGRVPRASPTHAKSEKKERGIQGPNTFSLRYGPSAKGGYDLSMSATDAGATLRALNILDGVRGGHLEIKGDGEGPESGKPIRGTIKVENFTVVEAPVLVRLLTVASLTGIGDFLSGGGLRFSRFIGDFTFDGRAIRTDGLRAHGSSIGLTARGEIDLKAREMILGGTIVPLYSVNRVLEKIPLIGGILVGRKGEGLVAVTYDLKGKLGDPKISVNPASVLAPGILRKIFGKISGSNEEEP